MQGVLFKLLEVLALSFLKRKKMKKEVIWFVALMVTLSFFAACGDDHSSGPAENTEDAALEVGKNLAFPDTIMNGGRGIKEDKRDSSHSSEMAQHADTATTKESQMSSSDSKSSDSKSSDLKSSDLKSSDSNSSESKNIQVCKDKGDQELNGDKNLEEKLCYAAVDAYMKAAKGECQSDELYDNYSRALVCAAEAAAEKKLNSTDIDYFFGLANENLAKVKDAEAVKEYVTALASVAKRQTAQEKLDYDSVVKAFAKIDSAISTARTMGVDELLVTAIRAEAENDYVAKNFPDAMSESDLVYREYKILKIAEIAPDNDEVAAALNESRKATRGEFLDFKEHVNEPVSSLIDKWGYVIAIPTIKVTSSSLSGELQVLSLIGTATEFDPQNAKVVSTDGREANVKGNTGWCEQEVLVGKKGEERIEKKQKAFKGRGKFMVGGKCSLNLSATYAKDFVPEYIEYKDSDGIGRKYLGL